MADPAVASKVNFYSVHVRSWLKNKGILQQFIPKIFKAEGKALQQLTIIFCSDKYLLKINQDYLKHNDYTDVITFDLSTDLRTIGEIYISLDRVRYNAKKYSVPLTTELHRILFHGILHLCGYSDKSPRTKHEMHIKENEYLLKYSHFVSREKGST